MQCFKGAWISNVLHDGIGVPRLTDKGGNDTLTSGKGGMNAEAEFRARQKGLFQSMDTVRNTAISWTLGKVVIEASRAVGGLPSGRWAPISSVRAHLGGVAPWILVAYALVALTLLALLFNVLRRRGGAFRRRKASFALPSFSLPAFVRNWLAPEASDLYVEEGSSSSDGGFAPAKRRAGRFRLWSRRVSAALRRNVQMGGETPHRSPLLRHVSMPLSTPLPQAQFPSSSGWPGMSTSQPSSPRGARSASMMDVTAYPHYPGLSTPGSGASSSVASTPRPPRPRTTSYNNASAEGWNDPPLSMLAGPGQGEYESSSGADDEWPGPNPKLAPKKQAKKRSGILTPSAGPGGERVLSRNSSRANLADSGHLAQRNSSRAGTPQRDL